MKTTSELDSDHLQRLRKREWLTERAGMFAIVLTLICALLGLLGPGPLSHRVQASADGALSVEHYAIERYESPTQLRVSFRHDATGNAAESGKPERETSESQTVTIGLSRSFTEHVQIEAITPQPISARLGDDQIEYSFLLSELQGPGTVVFQYAHTSVGSVKYSVTLADEPRVQISQFILP